MSDLFYRYNQILLDLFTMSKPTACAVKGHCLGAGETFLLTCDYRYAAAGKTLIGLNEIKKPRSRNFSIVGIPKPPKYSSGKEPKSSKRSVFLEVSVIGGLFLFVRRKFSGWRARVRAATIPVILGEGHPELTLLAHPGVLHSFIREKPSASSERAGPPHPC